MEIVDVIISRVKELVPPGTAVGPQSSIMGDLGLDSLTVMNFVMWLEDKFDISVPMDRLVDVETIADLAEVLHKLGARKV
ncbi:MAG: acyl carrier protein [Rhizomicrobium sp.]